MMKINQPLADAVDLYRRAERPEWREGDGQFNGELKYAESRDLLDRLHRTSEGSGRLDDLKVDGHSVTLDLDEHLPATGDVASFLFSTPMKGGARFFRNIQALAHFPPLGRGEFPDCFYLVEEDYLHGDDVVPQSIRDLMDLARFVAELAELADHKGETEGTGAWTLTFRTRDGVGILETEFTEAIIGLKIPDVAWEVVTGLRNASDGIHQKEKRWMFTATMCEFLENDASFVELVEHATKWAGAYENDLQTYLSGFSFEEVKRKIAEERARFAEKISTILGDITVKVLSLPLSVAVAMILKAQAGSTPWWFPVLLLLMVAFAISFLVRHYQRVAIVVQRDIYLVFGKLGAGTPIAYPKDLGNSLRDAVESLQRDAGKLRTTLRLYMVVTWAVPIIGGAMMLCA